MDQAAPIEAALETLDPDVPLVNYNVAPVPDMLSYVDDCDLAMAAAYGSS